MTTRSYVPREFFPTSPRSGNDGSKVFRMQNMILRGTDAEPYAEVYGGSLNLNEDIATSNLTGTVTTTTTSKVVVGVGTLFKTELHLGQHVEIFSGATRIPTVVDEIIDDTNYTACRQPHAAVAGATAVRLPVMYKLGKRRGTQIWGNVSEADLGTLLGVGDGTVRRNGAVLPGTSMVATRAPKIGLFNATTGNYTVFTLGMATPATLVAGAAAGTGKNMQAGVYSVRVVPARQATFGYNNPSPKAEVTLTAGQQIQITNISAADTANGQDAWMIFVTQYTQVGGINGPWYRYELPGRYVPLGAGAGQIAAAGGVLGIPYNIEYNDFEVDGNDILSFNNDAPPHAEFTTRIGGIQVYISCQGPGSTSPGPFIAVSKRNNVEAAPAALYTSTSPPDTIVGYHIGLDGRLYLMCVNSLQIAIPTQAQDPRIPPIAVRPFWDVGFKNPETLVSTGNVLLGMTTNGLAKSLAEGDVSSEEFGFAVAIEELIRGLSAGHCLLKLDPKNNAVVLFHSGHNINESGFWTTRAWMFGMRENRWIGDILLTSEGGDMLVSSAATVNGQLEFLCGGRQSGGTTVVRTYRWDTTDPGGLTVPWYLAWQFSDFGNEFRTKAVKGVRFIGGITGQTFTDHGLSIHGAEPGEVMNVTNLETDPIGKSGIVIPSTVAAVGEGDITELDVDNLSQLTVRVCGAWDGFTTKDRIDEVVLDVVIRGAKR